MVENELPLLSCLHHSLFWLHSRQFSRREDVFTKGVTRLEHLQSLGPLTSRASLQTTQAQVIEDVIRSTKLLSPTGECAVSDATGIALFMQIQVSESALHSASVAALMSARLLVRWRVSLHVTALTMSCKICFFFLCVRTYIHTYSARAQRERERERERETPPSWRVRSRLL